jgi:hypothetical protein
LLYLPFHFSFASFWLAVRLFFDKNEIDRIPTINNNHKTQYILLQQIILNLKA